HGKVGIRARRVQGRLLAERAERATGDVDDLRVLGRASRRAVADQLQFYGDAVGVPAPVLFRGRVADVREDGLLELEQLVHAVGAHVDLQALVAGDGVDGGAAADDADSEAALGRGGVSAG